MPKARLVPEGRRTGVAKNVRDYAKLVTQKNALDKELKSVKKLISEKEQSVMDHFQQMGYQSLNIDGITIYLNRRLQVGKRPEASPEQLVAALTAAGMEEYVKPTINARSITSYYRNVEETLETIPNSVDALLQPEVRDVLNIHEIYSIGARKS